VLPSFHQPPSPDYTLIVRTRIQALAQDLERELVHVDLGHRPSWQMKAVYDAVYLPVASKVADGLEAFCFDLSILRLPLSEDLAATQLRIILEVLYHFGWLLSEF